MLAGGESGFKPSEFSRFKHEGLKFTMPKFEKAVNSKKSKNHKIND